MATTRATTNSSSSFFSSLLSPSLLSLSPLQLALTFLKDTEIVRFCRVNHDHYAIWPKMRLNEYHMMSAENWTLIQQRQGPIVTSIELIELTGLSSIPSSERDAIRRVRFMRFGESAIARDSMPPLLEVLWSYDLHTHQNLTSQQLPILPSTLKTLIIALWVENDEDGENVRSMMKRILSEAQNLTELQISVHHLSLFSVLPSSIESLSIFLYIRQLPEADGWPKGLKHLSIELSETEEDDEEDDEDAHFVCIHPPPHLESIEFLSDYNCDEETLKHLSKLTSLRRVEYGYSIRNYHQDIFALLPRTVTHVTSDRANEDLCAAAKVDSLPDSVEVLNFAINNQVINRWPSALRVLNILNESFAQNVSNLPNSVEELTLPTKYSCNVSKWPTQLKKLVLGHQYSDLASVERLPAGVTHLSVSILVVRKLMLSGKLPSSLVRLELYIGPDPTLPFDVRQLPISVRQMVFDSSTATLIGMNERNVDVQIQRLTADLKEVELETQFLLSQLDLSEDDPEESIPFVPQQECRPNDPVAVASSRLFYVKPIFTPYAAANAYEVTLNNPHFNPVSYPDFNAKTQPPAPTEVIEHLAAASPSSPVRGVLFSAYQTTQLMYALGNALADGKINGSLSLADCTHDCRNQAVRQSPLYQDVVGLEPSNPDWMKAHQKQAVNEMMQLIEAMPNSKITHLQLTDYLLFGRSHYTLVPISQVSPSGSPMASVYDLFAALCRSISRMPTLLTIAFRGFWFPEKQMIGHSMLQQLTEVLLSPACASIERVELSQCQIEGNYQPIVQLIRETHTLKYLDLSGTIFTITGIWKVAQAIAVNRSLVTISLTGNQIGVFGLNALRWALRENRRIAIMVAHQSFGAAGLELLKKKRHARLKEISSFYGLFSQSGV